MAWVQWSVASLEWRVASGAFGAPPASPQALGAFSQAQAGGLGERSFVSVMFSMPFCHRHSVGTSFPRERPAGHALIGFDVSRSCPRDHALGQLRRGARLVPAGGLEPVPHELLVEGLLRTAWPVLGGGPVT